MVWPFSSSKNDALVKERRAARDALIDEARKRVSKHEDVRQTILSSDIADIVQGIESRTWTSTVVVDVFIGQAILAHEKTNCLTEVNFAAAFKRAKALDEEFEKTGKLSGPLHGIPFSLKDHYSLQGKQSVTGYTEWFKKEPAKEDGALAKIAQHLGAVCIAKTNVPQTMLNFECRNPAWGQTSNPYNDGYTAGGSSGGEAALLSAGGSAFGFGSDIGGSLRIPTSYCGIYALKPSNGRGWPREGNIDIGPSPNAIASVAGPMCRSLADLELLMRLFTTTLSPPIDSAESPRDVQRRFGAEVMPCIPLRPAWLDPVKASLDLASKRSTERKPIRIGYYVCDGFTKTTPACLRAMRIVQEALTETHGTNSGAQATVELVPIQPQILHTFTFFKTFVGLTAITGYDHLKRHLGPDRIDRALFLALALPSKTIIRYIIALVARYVLRDRYVPQVVVCVNGKTATRYLEEEYNKKKLTEQFENQVWNALDLDAIICPVQASPALPHYGSTLLASLAASTILFNALGNPVTVVPVTRVDAAQDSLLPSKSNERQLSLWKEQPGAETCSPMTSMDLQRQYNAERAHGLPVGVQVVTRDYEDEKSIGMAKLLDDALAQHSPTHRQTFGPGAWQRYSSF